MVLLRLWTSAPHRRGWSSVKRSGNVVESGSSWRTRLFAPLKVMAGCCCSVASSCGTSIEWWRCRGRKSIHRWRFVSKGGKCVLHYTKIVFFSVFQFFYKKQHCQFNISRTFRHSIFTRPYILKAIACSFYIQVDPMHVSWRGRHLSVLQHLYQHGKDVQEDSQTLS